MLLTGADILDQVSSRKFNQIVRAEAARNFLDLHNNHPPDCLFIQPARETKMSPNGAFSGNFDLKSSRKSTGWALSNRLNPSNSCCNRVSGHYGKIATTRCSAPLATCGAAVCLIQRPWRLRRARSER
jgi:hypothetical protein